ncbi:MAG: hypothetical protein M1834_002333 [Cirrosporium novae-zelandiae]|nr:MAG: hypothetical protein M1834_002333 [Cirrosporium novae-zelandiae]
MNVGNELEAQELAKARVPKLPTPVAEKGLELVTQETSVHEETEYPPPTEEERQTLHRVSGYIPWQVYTVAFVEMCERFSYYGTTAVFVNFIQQPRPEGSSTGAGYSGQSGALGMGQRASTVNQFWAYCMPLLGAYLADQYWGRMKTIQISIAVALVGHVILIISALPPVIDNPHGAIAAFSIGLVIMGLGTGGFKPNVSVLITEQIKETKEYVQIDKKGNRVIVDPVVTVSRIYLYFYFVINVGSLVGSIAMVYAEKYVGFWLSFLLPTIMFAMAPFVLYFCRKKYILLPPTGSTFAKAMKLWGLAMKGQWSWNPMQTRKNIASPDFWERVKPSNITNKPAWMTFDDAWVEEVRRGLMACKVFLWYPLYWLAYNQMTNNLTSQAATMELNGVPNDIFSNFNPLSIIILIPIMDFWVYAGLRKAGINFTPLKRITFGFFIASCAMISACVTQYYIYKKGKCHSHMNDCDETAPISVWVQVLPYGLIGASEIMASITSLEYAFTKAPKNMRSMVQAVALFMNAVAAAIGQALVALAEDPLLIWNYGCVAVVAFIGGVLFWIDNRKLDKEEERLNNLAAGDFQSEVSDEEKNLAAAEPTRGSESPKTSQEKV